MCQIRDELNQVLFCFRWSHFDGVLVLGLRLILMKVALVNVKDSALPVDCQFTTILSTKLFIEKQNAVMHQICFGGALHWTRYFGREIRRAFQTIHRSQTELIDKQRL